MRDDYARLKKIKECLEWIEQYTARGETLFLKDHMCQDAVLRNFQVIGDAIKELTPDFIKQYSDIDWSGWARFRDKLTHDYFGVDLDLVWKAANERVPEFKKRLEEMLNQDQQRL